MPSCIEAQAQSRRKDTAVASLDLIAVDLPIIAHGVLWQWTLRGPARLGKLPSCLVR
jgi:hypothetical protein